MPIKFAFGKEDLENFKKITDLLNMEFDENWSVEHMGAIVVFALFLMLLGSFLSHVVLALLLINVFHIGLSFWGAFWLAAGINILYGVLQKIYWSIFAIFGGKR